MKKGLLVIAFACLLQRATAQQTAIPGDWEGTLSGTALRLVFHFTGKDEKLHATMDSPDQDKTGLPCDSVFFKNDSLHVALNIAAAHYDGVLERDKNTITGNWNQRGQRIAVVLKRGTTVSAVKPQTPTPPFPYVSEDVQYDTKDKSVHFGATLTKPKGAGPFPAAIIISGSGSQDRDGSIMGHKTYLVLADYLTKNGIAVLRVDDRGVGQSTIGPDVTKITSADFADDVATSLSYLQSRTDIDQSNIGLIGHSEGGLIAPMVATTHKGVAFIVLLAGPGEKGSAMWNYQMQNMLEKENLSAGNKALADTLVNTLFAAVATTDSLKAIQQQMAASYKSWKAAVSDSLQAQLFKIPMPLGVLQMITTYKSALSWIRYFMNYDPAPALQKVTCPVLALNGENDVQVRANENLPLIKDALEKGGNKKVTVTYLPQLNHLFQTAITKQQSFAAIEETFAPAAMAIISSWIHDQIK